MSFVQCGRAGPEPSGARARAARRERRFARGSCRSRIGEVRLCSSPPMRFCQWIAWPDGAVVRIHDASRGKCIVIEPSGRRGRRGIGLSARAEFSAYSTRTSWQSTIILPAAIVVFGKYRQYNLGLWGLYFGISSNKNHDLEKIQLFKAQRRVWSARHPRRPTLRGHGL